MPPSAPPSTPPVPSLPPSVPPSASPYPASVGKASAEPAGAPGGDEFEPDWLADAALQLEVSTPQPRNAPAAVGAARASDEPPAPPEGGGAMRAPLKGRPAEPSTRARRVLVQLGSGLVVALWIATVASFIAKARAQRR